MITVTHARQILDSRGYPTVEVEVTLDSGHVGRAAAPAGSSAGRLEATELRDGGEKWSAMGVSSAVEAVRSEIAALLRGRDPHDQAAVDQALIALDGTHEKSQLAGKGPVQLPVPLLDVVNGGVHAANRLDFEEFMIVPAAATSFTEALRMGVEVFHELRYTLLARGRGTLIGSDGGFAPDRRDAWPRGEVRRAGRVRPRRVGGVRMTLSFSAPGLPDMRLEHLLRSVATRAAGAAAAVAALAIVHVLAER